MNTMYRQALEKALHRLTGEYSNLRVVLLAGSVARGEGGLTSDLDLYCLTDATERIRHTWIIDGVLIEIFLNPHQQILEYLAEEDSSAMHMLLTGRVVFGDPDDPLLLRLRRMAEAAFNAGPRPHDQAAQTLNRYMALDLYEDTLDVEADRGQSMWTGMTALQRAVSFHYRMNGRWEAKPKRILTDLAVWSPEVAKGIREYLAEGTLPFLKTVLDTIYAPFGGIGRFSYSSGADDQIPLAETEIILIRHGWPSEDPALDPAEWGLDYTAYLDLALFLNHPDLRDIRMIYTSPQVMAKQTAGFYFAQLGFAEMKVEKELAEVAGVTPADGSAVKAFFAGEDGGIEKLAEARERIVSLVRRLGDTARRERQPRIALVGHGLLFAVLRQGITSLPPEEAAGEWEQIPYGPYAGIRVDAFGGITWLGVLEASFEE